MRTVQVSTKWTAVAVRARKCTQSQRRGHRGRFFGRLSAAAAAGSRERWRQTWLNGRHKGAGAHERAGRGQRRVLAAAQRARQKCGLLPARPGLRAARSASASGRARRTPAAPRLRRAPAAAGGYATAGSGLPRSELLCAAVGRAAAPSPAAGARRAAAGGFAIVWWLSKGRGLDARWCFVFVREVLFAIPR